MKTFSASRVIRSAVAGCGMVMFGLAACGDDVTKINENDATAVLESGEKLSKQACDTTNVGETMYVKDSSATFVCDGEFWNTFDGPMGEPGEDCSAKKNSDGNYELTCGNEKIGVVENGRIGKDGDNCSIASDKDGIVLLVCGKGKDADTTKFFKAVCGDESFDPSEEYCYESKLYSCNGKPYNPSTQYCEDKKIKDRSSAK